MGRLHHSVVPEYSHMQMERTHRAGFGQGNGVPFVDCIVPFLEEEGKMKVSDLEFHDRGSFVSFQALSVMLEVEVVAYQKGKTETSNLLSSLGKFPCSEMSDLQ